MRSRRAMCAVNVWYAETIASSGTRSIASWAAATAGCEGDHLGISVRMKGSGVQTYPHTRLATSTTDAAHTRRCSASREMPYIAPITRIGTNCTA